MSIFWQINWEGQHGSTRCPHWLKTWGLTPFIPYCQLVNFQPVRPVVHLMLGTFDFLKTGKNSRTPCISIYLNVFIQIPDFLYYKVRDFQCITVFIEHPFLHHRRTVCAIFFLYISLYFPFIFRCTTISVIIVTHAHLEICEDKL